MGVVDGRASVKLTAVNTYQQYAHSQRDYLSQRYHLQNTTC